MSKVKASVCQRLEADVDKLHSLSSCWWVGISVCYNINGVAVLYLCLVQLCCMPAWTSEVCWQLKLSYRLNAKHITLSERRVLRDCYGHIVCTMKKKLASLHGTWIMYRGDSDSGGHKIAEIKPHLLNVLSHSVDVYLRDGDHEPDFVVKGNLRAKRFKITQVDYYLFVRRAMLAGRYMSPFMYAVWWKLWWKVWWQHACMSQENMYSHSVGFCDLEIVK